MKLAILHHTYGRFGGAEKLTIEHFLELRRRNVEAQLFYSGSIKPWMEGKLAPHEVVELPTGVPTSSKNLVELHRLIKTLEDFDKILIHHHVCPFLAHRIANRFSSKTVLYSGSMLEATWERWITGLDYREISPTITSTSREFYGNVLTTLALNNCFFPLTIALMRALDIKTVKSYGKIIANSRFLASFMQRIYRLKNTPSVVYPGIDPSFGTRVDPTDAELLGERYALIVGALIPLKNIEIAIKASSLLKHPLSLVIAGRGQEKPKLESIAKKLHVVLRIKKDLTEQRLAHLYAHCEFLLHLSLYEPFGLTPLEAGLLGKPSIVTNRGGPTETVIDGETGFVVDPLNPHKVAEKMMALLSDPTLRSEMGKAAQRRVLQMFTLSRSTQGLLEELET